MDYRERWELKDYLFGQVVERRILLVHVVLSLLLLAFLLDFWYLQGVHPAAKATPSNKDPERPRGFSLEKKRVSL